MYKKIILCPKTQTKKESVVRSATLVLKFKVRVVLMVGASAIKRKIQKITEKIIVQIRKENEKT